jgi:hypothetical protein
LSKIFKKYKLDSKMKDMLLILTLGILLIIAITQVFQPQNECGIRRCKKGCYVATHNILFVCDYAEI